MISARWTPEDLDGLRRTVRWANQLGVRVVLFGPMVEYDAPLPRLLAISIQRKDGAIPHRHLMLANWPLDEQMAHLAETERGVKYISLIAPLCKQQTCASYASEGIPLEFDSNHLTREGSLVVAQRLKAAGGL
jgi:hypothetical protein